MQNRRVMPEDTDEARYLVPSVPKGYLFTRGLPHSLGWSSSELLNSRSLNSVKVKHLEPADLGLAAGATVNIYAPIAAAHKL